MGIKYSINTYQNETSFRKQKKNIFLMSKITMAQVVEIFPRVRPIHTTYSMLANVLTHYIATSSAAMVSKYFTQNIHFSATKELIVCIKSTENCKFLIYTSSKCYEIQTSQQTPIMMHSHFFNSCLHNATITFYVTYEKSLRIGIKSSLT